MTQYDEEIDKILKALHTAEPAAGMEQRILANLTALQTQPVRRRTFSVKAWLIPAGVAALVLVGVSLVHRHADPAQHVNQFAIVKQPALSMTRVQASTPVKKPVVRLEARPAQAPHVAMAYGYPAPPMPLTDQEKMLVLLAHRGGPQETAALELEKQEPETLEHEDAAQPADFTAFFAAFHAPAPTKLPPEPQPTEPTGDDLWQPAK